MIIESCQVGPLATNCYIVADEASREGVVIDPGDDADEILQIVRHRNLHVGAILLTHGHFDHVGAVADLHDATGAPLWCHEEDVRIVLDAVNQGASFGCSVKRAPDKVDFLLQEGIPVNIGPLSFRVLHTPGHTKGGVTLVTGKHAFTGDSLFCGGIGRTDFEGGSHRELLASIKTKIFSLDDDTTVYPGHGPTSTIGYEKKNNPFVRYY
ncbi:MBL fold metallo-hydrolase [bacterium]|nr:MBL fold metallo-hydrolase [bacterium]